jgi:DHA1 family inner membrane transport protein
MPLALYALTAGAFGIGVTEFVIMGLLLDMSADLGVSPGPGRRPADLRLCAGRGRRRAGADHRSPADWPRKTVLLALMAIFTIGNAACAAGARTTAC